MPGWHDATEELQESGKVQMLGILQEQNPERANLFMQWKQMGWPILVDTFNQLEVSVVPLTYAIDEHGIVQMAGLRTKAVETIEQDFVSRSYPAPSPASGDDAQKRNTESQRNTQLAVAALSDEPETISAVIEHFRAAVESDPEDGWPHFRLAAAHRLRYDSRQAVDGDFQLAIDHWQKALDLDPNNYIWRRRIQQYGPRLDKPYPFYDWIEPARADISARGEVPHPLRVTPTGSEIARPGRGISTGASISSSVATPKSPDPMGRVTRDSPKAAVDRLILLEQTAVPQRIQPGDTTRLHLVFRPNTGKLAHWNNETEPLRIWLDLPEGWQASGSLLEHPNPMGTAVSTETRRIEVEIVAPKDPAQAKRSPSGYALYYVCEDEQGVCLYRRQDIDLGIGIN